MTLIHPMKVEIGDPMKWETKVVQELVGEFNQNLTPNPTVCLNRVLGGHFLEIKM